MRQPIDPGYGDPLAPIGTAEWAKRWRLEFQSVVKDMPQAPGCGRRFYEAGEKYHAWTLLTDGEGKFFRTFDSFCAYPQPYGLGMEPAKFRAYLEAEMGKKAADLATVSPGDDKGGRPKGGETPDTVSAVSGAEKRKGERLRAIIRAPEIVQQLYKDGKLTQADAAKMGPKSPTPEQAAKVAVARQAIENLPLVEPTDFRKQAGKIIRETLGSRIDTPLDLARKALSRLPEADLDTLLLERLDLILARLRHNGWLPQ